MIFLLVLSVIAGMTGCVITTAGLPENLRWQGIQCGAITAIAQAGILHVIPLDRDGSGLLIAGGIMLAQCYSPRLAEDTRKLRVHFGIRSAPGYLLMYVLCMVLTGVCWLPIWMALR